MAHSSVWSSRKHPSASGQLWNCVAAESQLRTGPKKETRQGGFLRGWSLLVGKFVWKKPHAGRQGIMHEASCLPTYPGKSTLIVLSQQHRRVHALHYTWGHDFHRYPCSHLPGYGWRWEPCQRKLQPAWNQGMGPLSADGGLRDVPAPQMQSPPSSQTLQVAA